MPYILILIFALISFIFPSLDIFAQDTQTKTQNLITALAKTKYKKKEKKGITVEAYVDIKNEAVIKNSVRDYAGIYETSNGEFRLELKVSAGGSATGNGYDYSFIDSSRQSFTLKDARIEGALLTATKVYANGKTQNFEAVFNNETRTEGRNPNEITRREAKYGLGFIEYNTSEPGSVTNRVFLEFKP